MSTPMQTNETPVLATTLHLLQEHGACKAGYVKLRKALPTRWAMDKPIDLLTVLESNGLLDTLWCFCATTTPANTIAKLYACDCIEHVQHLYKPPTLHSKWRPAQTILVVRRYALGMETGKQLKIAAAAAAANAANAADAAGNVASAYVARAADDVAYADANNANAVFYSAAYAAAYAAAHATNAADHIGAFRAECTWQTERLREWLTGQRIPETTWAEIEDAVHA